MSSNSIHAEPPPPVVTEPSGISYATGGALGKGGFAICHKAERYDGSRPTGQIVALKIVKTRMEPAKLAQKFVTELQIHSKLSHSNIVTFHRAFSFQTSTYVVLELCPNGSLADMLKKRKQVTLPEIRRLVIQVCGAVKYLHHRHIVHRDLKTGNLFLDHRMNVKVGDFGLAALLVTERDMEVRRRTTMCGTPNYLAPEILEKGKGHDEKVDLWAIGVIAYTLAVGKAPFHASTKEEIYKKLRSGTYTWPELTATTNQSADLRDLVSSILVEEQQRPNPDAIVSHKFFKIAYVPAEIPTSARTEAPRWEVSIPSADTMRRGYSETWFALCKESGVGEYEEGRCFPLNGGRKIRSIVHDMEKETQLGRQPMMPIPKDVVYTSMISDFERCSPDTSATSEEPPRRVQASRPIKEISHNEVATSRPPRIMDTVKAARDAELMPPPRAPSRTARTAGTGSVRRAARTISEETAARSSESVKIASDPSSSGPSSSATVRVAKTRPTPVPSSSAPATVTMSSALRESKNYTSTTTAAYQTAQSEQSSDPLEKPQRSGTVKRSADASLARRPRAPKPTQERPASPVEQQLPAQPSAARVARKRNVSQPVEQGPFATLDELKKVEPFRTRRKAPAPEVIEILSDPESDDRDELKKPTESIAATLRLPRPPKMTARLPQPQRKTNIEAEPAVPETDPTAVLSKLATFRDNLARELTRSATTKSTSSLRRDSNDPAAGLPFVSRWVDYSRKHGVGYVLSDGTVGCIINATAKAGQTPTPVTHVLVRNGQRWLKKVQQNKDFTGIDQVPLEIFEDRGLEGIKRKVYKGLGSVKEGPLLVEAERRRTLSVLWVKFGRYMCQSLDGSEESGSTGHDQENFVRFYQRIGNVGVWAFADGCLQVHFPDHTKIVLSSSGQVISATVLTPEATSHLSQNGDLQPQHVTNREVLADGVHAMLFEGGRVRQRIVKANQLPGKLAFIQDVVSQWINNNGLGRLDEDQGGAKLSWEGLTVKENKTKVDRVTVGRCGGDDLRSAVETVKA
ncbi:Putative serine/threonine-protein kinase, active [Septoria linicola]|uniref:Serine/threonine-protein kinase n=1 Tax=Septoria linicola TaxID=215465 RepID=A0A9Q9EJX9_9PEZI|nr:Putative serine/threonine-protein kinase, active [Septoria linicola]